MVSLDSPSPHSSIGPINTAEVYNSLGTSHMLVNALEEYTMANVDVGGGNAARMQEQVAEFWTTAAPTRISSTKMTNLRFLDEIFD